MYVTTRLAAITFTGDFGKTYGFRIRSTDSNHWRRVYGWMATAFGAWVVTVLLDLISLYATIAWLNPGTLLDLLWYLPYALFVVSLLVGRQPHEDVTAPARSAPGLMSDSPLIAYAGTLMAIHILLDVTGMFDSRLHVARGVLVVLETLILGIIIFKAQRLVMRESRRLHRGFEEVSSDLERANRGLEERVRQRTAEIVATNRQLREAEARNLALIRAVPDALVLVDRAGVVREVYPSRDSTDVLDLTSFRGRLLGDELPAEYRADIDQAMNRIRDGAGQQTLAMTVANSSGSRHFELRGGQCGNDEILVLIQDVTERQDFESSLQQSQRLESLGIMAGGIAHDFNNLLVSILGNAQLALESLPAGADVPRTLAAIESGAIRAAKLTSNLLAYAGEAHIERETLDLVRVFAEMDTLLATAVPKRTRFRFDCGNEPLWIDANEAQVTQILLNLVRNAAEALPGGDGDIEVSLQRCRIDDAGLVGQVLGETLLPGDHVRLQVRDSGYGMDAEIQQRIFDPFFTSKGTGRGLGLAAVLGIVNHHRAALTLDSRPDEGTTFSVYFPARVAPTTAPATSATSTAIRSTGTILVADDEEGVRDLITAYLETLGLSTVVAMNGRQAVEMAQSHRGRLTAILMDYAMPEMNGVEAYHIIRREDPDVPVIMLSGYGERRALGPLADDDQTEFLQKPFRLNDLAAALREPLGLSG